MRLVATINNPKEAKQLSCFLKMHGIENSCDMKKDENEKDKTCIISNIWIHDENLVTKASEMIKKFRENPVNIAPPGEDQLSAIRTPPSMKSSPKKRRFPCITTTFALVALFLFLLFNFLALTKNETIIPLYRALTYDTANFLGIKALFYGKAVIYQSYFLI